MKDFLCLWMIEIEREVQQRTIHRVKLKILKMERILDNPLNFQVYLRSKIKLKMKKKWSMVKLWRRKAKEENLSLIKKMPQIIT